MSTSSQLPSTAAELFLNENARSNIEYITDTLIPNLRKSPMTDELAHSITTHGNATHDTIPWIFAIQFYLINPVHVNTGIRLLNVLSAQFNPEAARLAGRDLGAIMKQLVKSYPSLSPVDQLLIPIALNRMVASLDDGPQGGLLTAVHVALAKLALRGRNFYMAENIISTDYSRADLSISVDASEITEFYYSCAAISMSLRRYKRAIQLLTIAMSTSPSECRLADKICVLWVLACLIEYGQLLNKPKYVAEAYQQMTIPPVPTDMIPMDVEDSKPDVDMLSQKNIGDDDNDTDGRYADDDIFDSSGSNAAGAATMATTIPDINVSRRKELHKVHKKTKLTNPESKPVEKYFALARAFDTKKFEEISKVLKEKGELFAKDITTSEFVTEAIIRYKERYVSDLLELAFLSMDMSLFDRSQLEASSGEEMKDFILRIVLQGKVSSCKVDLSHTEDGAPSMTLHVIKRPEHIHQSCERIEQVIGRVASQITDMDKLARDVIVDRDLRRAMEKHKTIKLSPQHRHRSSRRISEMADHAAGWGPSAYGGYEISASEDEDL